jgi:hypothetical protein
MKESDMKNWDKAMRRKIYEAEISPASYVQHDLFRNLQAEYKLPEVQKERNSFRFFPYAAVAAASLLFIVYFLNPDQPTKEPMLEKPLAVQPEAAVLESPAPAVLVNKKTEVQLQARPKQSVSKIYLAEAHETFSEVPQSVSAPETEIAVSEPVQMETQESSPAVQQSFMMRLSDPQSISNNRYEPVSQSYRPPVVFLEKEKERLLKDFPPARSVFRY